MCKSTKSKRDREGLRSGVQRQRERARERWLWWEGKCVCLNIHTCSGRGEVLKGLQSAA